jgi:sterol carrier protein 2
MIKMVRLRHGEEGRRPRRSTRRSGFGPKDVQVVELHDCFTANELLTYEALGLCKRGRGREASSEDGDNTYGGKVVTNPSAAACSPRATRSARPASAQCTELVWQLRGTGRQAPGAEREGRPAAQPRARRRLPS